MTADSYVCATCGASHSGPPLSYGARAPYSYERLTRVARLFRASLGSDTCTIRPEHYFVLGSINLPVIGRQDTFSWSVWVSLSKPNYQRSLSLWRSPGREAEPPYFGWLNTLLPCYPSTLSLKTSVQTQAVGIRPSVVLEPTDHPLAIEQREGISWDRVHEIAAAVLHPSPVFTGPAYT